jgi:hypothetical protein
MPNNKRIKMNNNPTKISAKQMSVNDAWICGLLKATTDNGGIWMYPDMGKVFTKRGGKFGLTDAADLAYLSNMFSAKTILECFRFEVFLGSSQV